MAGIKVPKMTDGTLATDAGVDFGITATAPTASAASGNAGAAVNITASVGVADTDTAGDAQAGGDVTITAGAAARNTSGNANGGDINLVGGAGIGTGTVGSVVIPGGTTAIPGVIFDNDTNTGIASTGAGILNLVSNGTARIAISAAGTTTFGGTVGFAANILSGMKACDVQPIVGVATSNQTAANTGRHLIASDTSTGKVTINLPTAASGLQFTIMCNDVSGIRVVAAASDDIQLESQVTAAAGYIETTTVGDCVHLIAVDTVTWMAVSYHGTWTNGTWTLTQVGAVT